MDDEGAPPTALSHSRQERIRMTIRMTHLRQKQETTEPLYLEVTPRSFEKVNRKE